MDSGITGAANIDALNVEPHGWEIPSPVVSRGEGKHVKIT